MLGLRLNEGVSRGAAARRFTDGSERFDELLAQARLLEKQQPKHDPVLHATENSIALTRSGFLVSNAIIATLLDL